MACDIRQLLGTPFRMGGRGRSGLDCYGLIWLWHLEEGVPIEDPLEEYDADPRCDGVNIFEVNAGEQWLEESPPYRRGTVILFGDGQAAHAGVHLGKGKVLHSTRKHGAIVTHVSRVGLPIYRAYRRAEWLD